MMPDFEDIEDELRRLRAYMKHLWEFRPFLFRWPELEIKWPEFREPLVDIEETPEEIKVTVELPGIDKEDIDIDVTPTTLRIKAEKKKAEIEKRKGYYRSERAYKGFYRELSLPCRVVPEKVTAEYKNGILTITLPKAEKKEVVRKVKIK